MSTNDSSNKKSSDPINEKEGIGKEVEEISKTIIISDGEKGSKDTENGFQTPRKNVSSEHSIKEETPNVDIFKYNEQRKFIFNFYPSPFQFQKYDELSPIPQVDNGLNGIWNVAYPAFYNIYKNIEIESCPYIFTESPGIKHTWMKRRIYNANRIYLFLTNFKVDKNIFNFALNYMDRYVFQLEEISDYKYSEIAAAATFLASKFNTDDGIYMDCERFINVAKEISLCSNLTHEQLLSMEAEVGRVVGKFFFVPCTYIFIERYLKVIDMDENKEMIELCTFISLLALILHTKFRYSIIACSCILISRMILKYTNDPYPRNLRKHAEYDLKEIKECSLTIIKDIKDITHEYTSSDKDKKTGLIKCSDTFPSGLFNKYNTLILNLNLPNDKELDECFKSKE